LYLKEVLVRARVRMVLLLKVLSVLADQIVPGYLSLFS
ncbi:GntR family transcriptional regulator, partial [Pseudomonas syringae pv. tagetis]